MKKRNLALIISAIVLVLLALTGLILLYTANGELVKWLHSKWAVMFAVAIILYVVIVVIVLVKDKVNRL